MIKMTKNQVCYNKTCWSTKNTVLEEAEKIEESHVGEELVTRIKPHSHKKDNPIDKNNDINNNEKNEIKESIKDFSALYGKKLRFNIYNRKDRKTETAYDLNETYLIIKKQLHGKNSESNLRISNESDMPEYEEFMIEKTSIGSIKTANFYRTNAGMLKKLGLIPDYNINIFNRY